MNVKEIKIGLAVYTINSKIHIFRETFIYTVRLGWARNSRLRPPTRSFFFVFDLSPVVCSGHDLLFFILVLRYTNTTKSLTLPSWQSRSMRHSTSKSKVILLSPATRRSPSTTRRTLSPNTHTRILKSAKKKDSLSLHYCGPVKTIPFCFRSLCVVRLFTSLTNVVPFFCD
jgi:hypothetical protein